MSVCDIPVLSTVCQVAGPAAGTLVEAPFDWLAQAVGGAAQWMFQGVWTIFDSTTAIDLTSGDFVSVYNVLFGVAAFVMLVFFLLQLLTGLIRRDPGALSRAAIGLGKSVLGSFLVLTLTGTLLEIVDELCVGVVQATGTTLDEMGGKIGVLAAGLTGISIVPSSVGVIITIFLGFLALSAAAIIWFSLVVRKALLLVALVLAPIALSGATWDVTKAWVGRWASFVIALIFSKLVVVVVFLLAINLMNSPIDLDLSSISDPITGIVLMFIAAFAPYLAYKFISFIGFDVYHAMGAESEAKQALNRPVPMPRSPSGDGPKKVLDGDGDGGDGPSADGGGPPAPADASGIGEGAGAAGGAEAGGGAAAGGAGAAAAGPAAAAVIGAEVIKGAATAGPELGAAVGEAADRQVSAGQESAPSSAPPAPPTSAPGPRGPARGPEATSAGDGAIDG